MSLPNKLTNERNQKALLELATKPGNDICADCKARTPRWASYNLGIFICVNCASMHRGIGTHITKVKSITMDTWTKDQVDVMKSMGNIKSNAIYNPNETRHPPPPNLEDSERDSELEQYIRAKYEYRKFIDRNALVASKLGPSRSSAAPRSASSPLTSTHRSSTIPTAASVSTSKLASNPPAKPLASSSSQPALASQPSTSKVQPQSRVASQPVLSQQNQSPPKQNGVWEDLVQLQDNSSMSASLPLQFQPPTSASLLPTNLTQLSVNPPLSANYTGMSFNPFQQQQQLSAQSFGQQPQSAFNASSAFTAQFTGTPQLQQSYGQQLFMNQIASQPTANSLTAPVFQPQPQSAAPMQAPQLQGQMFLSSSSSSSPSGTMSAPVGQTQFLTPSPSQQFLSYSPQPVQNMFMTPSPQPAQSMFMTPQPTGFMANGPSYSPAPMTSNPSPYQMNAALQQQQQHLQQQQQQQQQQQLQLQQQQQYQQQGQFFQGLPQGMMAPNQYQAGMNTGQTYGFGAQQPQWGRM